jgi:hypothetical protein
MLFIPNKLFSLHPPSQSTVTSSTAACAVGISTLNKSTALSTAGDHPKDGPLGPLFLAAWPVFLFLFYPKTKPADTKCLFSITQSLTTQTRQHLQQHKMVTYHLKKIQSFPTMFPVSSFPLEPAKTPTPSVTQYFTDPNTASILLAPAVK